MTEEKIKQRTRIAETYNKLVHIKEKWEQAQSISKIELRTTTTYCGGSYYMAVDGSFVNFDDLKLLVLSKIQKRIDELQNEFDNM